jgi:hypothetical protein
MNLKPLRWISARAPLACGILCVLLAAGIAPAQTVSRDSAALQVALDREGFGVGLIDNRDGAKTKTALSDYCRSTGLEEFAAREQLLGGRQPPFRFHVVATQDLQQVGVTPTDWLEASQCARLSCETMEEWLSERYHVKPRFLRELNPATQDWDRTPAGTRLLVPNVLTERHLAAATSVEIDCSAFRLRAFDAAGRLLASFPCSIASDLSRVPAGELLTAAFAPDPVYVFSPANYPESARAQEIGRKLILPPGPNSPVGVFWIGLNAPGFGMHGTRRPETIGSRESHGCFRLTNWDVVALARMLRTGVPVRVTGVYGE